MFPAYLLLVVAITVLSQAGNIIRLCDSSPLQVAFLRLALALLMLAPWSVAPLRRGLREAGGRSLLILAGMGGMFALHFVSWIAAVQNTSVASAAICFSTSPLFTAIGARLFLKESFPPRIFYTIFLGIIGVSLVGFSDVSFSPRNLLGDALGVVSGLTFSIYLLIGKTQRQAFENRFVMCTVYFCGAFALAPFVAVEGRPFSALTETTWLALLALALLPTILGHASMIFLMRYFRASTLSVATLVEPVLAGIGAWIFFEEKLQPLVLAGYVLIVLGLLLMLPFRRLSAATPMPEQT